MTKSVPKNQKSCGLATNTAVSASATALVKIHLLIAHSIKLAITLLVSANDVAALVCHSSEQRAAAMAISEATAETAKGVIGMSIISVSREYLPRMAQAMTVAEMNRTKDVRSMMDDRQ
jgi:hypothetical protein